MKKITIEEHFSTEKHLHYLHLLVENKYPLKDVLEEEKYMSNELRWLPVSKLAMPSAKTLPASLLEVGEGRIKSMDQAGIDMQVLSLVSPGVQVFDIPTARDLAKETNDELARIIHQYPARFAGFATIAIQEPESAARELERAVKELGLKGIIINSHTKGEYLDEKKYRVVLEKAEKLGVPIYIHPRTPSPDMIKPFLTYPMVATSLFGFGVEVSLHAVRLICSGVFDEFPKLKIILGHLGEALPFWSWRLDNRWLKAGHGSLHKKIPSQYLKDNFKVTTSGMFSVPAMMCTYQELGADNILFAADHPFESSQDAVKFMDTVPISVGDKEKIYHSNAERLLRL